MGLTSRSRNFGTPYVYPLAMRKKSMVDVVDSEWATKRQAGILTCNGMNSLEYQSTEFAPLKAYYHHWYRQYSFQPWAYLGLKSLNVSLPVPQFTSAAAWGSSNPFGAATSKMSSLGFSLADPSSDGVGAQKHTMLSDRLSSGIALTGVSYIERLKTLRMFKEAVTLLKHPFINARNFLGISRVALRGNPNAMKTVMNEANKRWLEGRYGWRPLAYEVMAMFNAAAQGDNQRITVRSQNGAPSFTDTRSYTTWSTGYSAGVVNGEFAGSRICRYGQTGDFNFSVSNWGRDYGLYDVVGTAWEAVPYSFVVDWYLNVGEMLGALQAYVLLDERVGWTSDTKQLTMRFFPIVTVEGNLSAVKGNKTQFSHYDPPNWEAWERLTWRTRVPVTSFAPVIDFRCNLDVTKIIDQVALLAQVLGRRR